ncbi:MAG: histidine kinase [Deltaproteobacteria bacterium]
MKKNISNLRQRAEEFLKDKPLSPGDISPEEAIRLIHELQVHQIELEIQNEELVETQLKLLESNKKYADLYDFAPVGYLAVDRVGQILEANRTASLILGMQKNRLLGLYFPVLLPKSARQSFRLMLSSTHSQQEWQGEIWVKHGEGGLRAMLLRILFLNDAKGREIRRIAFTDISELKKIQEALEDSNQKLRQLTKRLLTSQEQERQRIARDLHDEMGQSLMALKMQLNAFKRRSKRGQEAWDEFDQAVGFIDVIAEEIGKICQSLRPAALGDLGLNAALQQLLKEFKKHHGLKISEELSDVSSLLSSEAQITVYRLFLECLTNAVRHGKATSVTVRIHRENSAFFCSCEDNGYGFDLSEVRSRGNTGLGLTAMEERVRLLQGSFRITSAKGKGTRIEILLPLDQG